MNAYQCWLIWVDDTHNQSDVLIGINYAAIGHCHEVTITGYKVGCLYIWILKGPTTKGLARMLYAGNKLAVRLT